MCIRDIYKSACCSGLARKSFNKQIKFSWGARMKGFDKKSVFVDLIDLHGKSSGPTKLDKWINDLRLDCWCYGTIHSVFRENFRPVDNAFQRVNAFFRDLLHSKTVYAFFTTCLLSFWSAKFPLSFHSNLSSAQRRICYPCWAAG